VYLFLLVDWSVTTLPSPALAATLYITFIIPVPWDSGTPSVMRIVISDVRQTYEE
jgi:hypothetical protein